MMHGRSVEKGFTLIELMVSLTIGLFIILGVLVVYVGGLRSYAVNDALSRVQENGRFALEFLSRDVRQTAYQPICEINNLLDVEAGTAAADLYLVGAGIEGWDDEAGDYSANLSNYQAETDVLMLKNMATSTRLEASGNTPANANNIGLTSASGITAGSIILVVDADPDEQRCDLFQKVNNENGSNLALAGSGGGSGNSPSPGNINQNNDFSHQYDGEIDVYQLQTLIYYIGEGSDGRVGLRRRALSSDGSLSNDVPLVSGVEDMQIEYGQDTDGDRNVDIYRDASQVTDWDEVLSIRVHLLVAGETDNVLETRSDTLPAPFATVGTSDRRLRKVFTSTVALRNKLP
ncbi:PilW family protein [Marinobacterium lutimaris]|uniref:Type IV pilus assembly protein PilW n=1 Tax=Marinobacterium lutimaris TaxID=568106 RepID=A0A1H6CV24_9GAMM|nr:PilW family protein [Marinobacterium lutimaris]SEG76880.1 type IV pilus assembly protein PilW [Marinobacterium lutimaris]